MKRVLLAIALLCAVVACGGKDENNNVDKRVRECYDRMYQGVANNDYETFEAAYSEVRELMSGDFGEGDKCKARNAVAAWNRENSDIVEQYSESYSAMIERYNENRE